MLSAKYHIATIIAIFVSLGVGIVIGGTLGQKWAMQAENSIVGTLTDRYELMLAENQAMRKKIGSLELYLKTVSPASESKVVWWYKSPGHNLDLLAMVLNAAGVRWVEKDTASSPLLQMKVGEPNPDYILVTDPVLRQSIANQLAELATEEQVDERESLPRLIDVSEDLVRWNEPESIVEFMIYMKQLVEEESYAAIEPVGIGHRSGME